MGNQGISQGGVYSEVLQQRLDEVKGAWGLLLKSVNRSSWRGIDNLHSTSCAHHCIPSKWPLVWSSGVHASMVEWPLSMCKECGHGYKFRGMEVSMVHSHPTPPGSLLHIFSTVSTTLDIQWWEENVVLPQRLVGALQKGWGGVSIKVTGWRWCSIGWVIKRNPGCNDGTNPSNTLGSGMSSFSQADSHFHVSLKISLWKLTRMRIILF